MAHREYQFQSIADVIKESLNPSNTFDNIPSDIRRRYLLLAQCLEMYAHSGGP